ncbi:HSF-type DNA-binding-domain-containing protein, partial [Tribonema minus]
MQTQHGYTDQGQLRPLTATAPAGFPYVLISILENESPEIITWSSTGRAFGIRNMAAFKTKILPQYFKHDKFSSFQRQLNLYGFRKIVKGRESGCYIHCYFQRGHPELLKQVRRGQVPPCPPRYERKVYGCSTRPRQGAGSALDGTARTSDSSSDSEPEMRRAFDAAPPRQAYGGAGGYGAAHAHSHLQQHVQQQPPPGGVDGAPWDGSFREQMERRETSSRRVTKLFPGRSTPLGAAFGAPAPAYTAPLDAPVLPHAQQHAMAFNGAPAAFGY